MELAPVAVFVYNRPAHTRKVLAALQQNDLASKSDLFIFADGLKVPAHASGVKEVREIISSVAGFRSVHVVERESNYGCARSITSGISSLLETHSRIIVVEDDVVVAPYFLKYINEALALYQDQEEVCCVHGYMYPVQASLPETFFVKGADIWGWGTWKRAWALYEYDAAKLLRQLKEQKLTREFDFDGCFGFTRMLEDQARGKLDTWDVQWYASAFLNGKLTLYPSVSLVKNIGFDSSGTHCDETEVFSVRVSQVPVKLERIQVVENAEAREAIGNFHRSTHTTLLQKGVRKVSRLLRNWSANFSKEA